MSCALVVFLLSRLSLPLVSPTSMLHSVSSDASPQMDVLFVQGGQASDEALWLLITFVIVIGLMNEIMRVRNCQNRAVAS